MCLSLGQLTLQSSPCTLFLYFEQNSSLQDYSGLYAYLVFVKIPPCTLIRACTLIRVTRVWPCMFSCSHVWPFYLQCGFICPFLAVKNPNPFGLVFRQVKNLLLVAFESSLMYFAMIYGPLKVRPNVKNTSFCFENDVKTHYCSSEKSCNLDSISRAAITLLLQVHAMHTISLAHTVHGG